MAWTNDLDPTTPSDTDPAKEGDDHLRMIKAGLEERLGSIIADWPDGDPIRLKAAEVDDIADRPATPEIDGQIFIAHTPEKRLYYGLSGAWHEINASALLGALINYQEIEDSFTVPANSNLHIHTTPFTLGDDEEVIAVWHQWRDPDLTVDFTSPTYTDARMNYSVQTPYIEGGAHLKLYYINVSRDGNVYWAFKNEEDEDFVADVRVRITTLKVRA